MTEDITTIFDGGDYCGIEVGHGAPELGDPPRIRARLLTNAMTPAEAREYAEHLKAAADMVEQIGGGE